MFKEKESILKSVVRGEEKIESASGGSKKAEILDLSLFRQIQAIKGLPSERLMHRYSGSGFGKEEKFEGKESLSHEATLEIIRLLEKPEKNDTPVSQEEAREHFDKLFQGKTEHPNQSINRIKKWVEENPDRLEEIGAKLIAHLKSGQGLNLTLLSFCGEVYPFKKLLYLEWELALAMDASCRRFTPEYIDQLAALSRLGKKEGNFRLHKILDFVQEFMATVQDPQYDEHDPRPSWVRGELFLEFCRFAEGEQRLAENYLVRKHLQDISEMIMMHGSEKEGAIPGTPGGASDEVIYKYRNVFGSHRNRLKLGINEGFPRRNPVLPLAPGFYGFYEDGKLKKIFPGNKANEVKLAAREKKYLAENNPEDEYIYDELNEERPIPARYDPKTYGLYKLEVLSDFRDSLKNAGRSFYFDTGRIFLEKLHPAVATQILTYNQEYLHEKEGKTNQTTPLTEEEYRQILFPLKNYSEDKDYSYRYLMSLGMRKRIEENFKFKLENMSIWEQKNFLAYLESADTEKVQQLQDFCQRFGREGLKAFLSLEYGQEYGDVLLDLGESKFIAPEQTREILREYNSLNDHALEIARIIKKSSFFDDLQLSSETAGTFEEQFSEAIMRRAKDILNTAQAIAKNGKAQAEFFKKRVLECDSAKEVIQALKIYGGALEKIECLLQPENELNRFNLQLLDIEKEQVPAIYDFAVVDKETGKKSFLTVQLRRKGVPLGEHNQEREFNGEARVNILTHNRKIGRKLTEKSRQEALSARFDLEGIVRLDGEIIVNDPAKGGQLSWEVGFVGEEKSSLPGDVIARVIAVGNALGEKRKKTEAKAKSHHPEYYHNRESFVKELGEPEVFAKVVDFIEREIESHYILAEKREKPVKKKAA